MKILLIIDHYFPTDESFIEEIYSKILPERGFDITILARTKEYREKKEIMFNKAKIILIPSRIKYLSDIFNISKFKSILKKGYDIIQVRNDPIFSIISLKNNFIYNLVHLKAEELLIRWKEKPLNIFKGIIDLFLRRIVLKRSCMVFTTSFAMNEYLIKKYGCKTVISMPVGTNPKTKIDPKKIQFIRKKYNLNNKITFIYIGTLDRFRKLNTIIDAYKIAKKDVDISFIILGGAINKKDSLILKQKIIKEKIKDIYIINRIPRNEVVNYIRSCDIGVSVIPVNNIYYYTSPTKTLEYLNEGIPVLASRIPFQEEIIRKSNSGLLCDFSIEDISEKMIELAKSKELKEMGNRGQKYVKKNNSYKKIADDLIKCYNDFLKELN